METFIVTPGDPGRIEVEHFIRKTYRDEYGAVLSEFPALIMAAFNGHGQIAAAAGIRSEADGFFSEAYLDHPIEALLTALCDSKVERREIFEVTSLASREPRKTAAFIDAIVRYGMLHGFQWSFFTLTLRLRQLLDRLGLDLAFLGSADRFRIRNHQSWGTYYAAEPGVFAIRSPARSKDLSTVCKRATHAEAA